MNPPLVPDDSIDTFHIFCITEKKDERNDFLSNEKIMKERVSFHAVISSKIPKIKVKTNFPEHI
ncbi:hypothetical protein ACKUB1_08365 [Methanospirillum stamsii]|uniref:Uncharacterized protein n=1 Tax=Methanospirillum stamsii TaxID=1277351 RepID=A0A2V2NAD8_9EURY|nr:hypothetical protein [Methanospirillum stamsii]PWR75710.1 hypothetical protein DLD82_03775 [Methanospirillum stamsii]